MTSSTDDSRTASSPRNLERDLFVGKGSLARTMRLGDRRVRDEPCDLVGRQTAEQAGVSRDQSSGGENRMAGGEHKAQEVVANVVVEGRVEIRLGQSLPGLKFATDFLVFALEPLVSPQEIERPMLRRGHEPGGRLCRTPDSGHCSSGDKRIWASSSASRRRARSARPAMVRPTRSPDRVDRAIDVGSRRSHRSTFPSPVQAEARRDHGITTRWSARGVRAPWGCRRPFGRRAGSPTSRTPGEPR